MKIEQKEAAGVLKELLNNITPEDIAKATTELKLVKAAHQYAKYTAAPPSDVAHHFVSGANWQKEQMVKNATEYQLYADGDFVTIDYDFSEYGLKEGDKVKLIIIKEAKK